MEKFLDQTEVLTVLHGLNPWWEDRPVQVPEFTRLAYHICRKYLSDKLLQRAVILSGPRRVGKTTVLLQVARSLVEAGNDPRSVLYLSLDHPILKLLPLSETLRVYQENVHPEGKPGTLLLDEVHYVEQWALHVKQLVDRRRELRILATGSASLAHHKELAESGVGRWTCVPMPTLSFYEFVRIRGIDTSAVPDHVRPADLLKMTDEQRLDLAARLRSLMPAFQRYLLIGGFPETARHEDISLCQRLLREDVVQRVLKRDMVSLFNIRNTDDLERLFTYLCIHSGGILAVKTCADALGTSQTTVSNHLQALEAANLIYRVSPWGRGGKKVLRSRQKVYLVDAALRNAVLLRGQEVTQQPEELGVIVETAILRHLYAYHYRDTPEVLYWRDAASGREVDIIVRSPKYVIPVEVKYRKKAELDRKQGLYEFCREEGPSCAYWVTQRESDFALRQFPGLRTQFLEVPGHVFAYLLGQAERLLWLG